jgi:hypothetical protein
MKRRKPMEIIFALILTVAGEPDYQKVYKTESGCQNAITREVAAGTAEAGFCHRIEVPLSQEG